MSLPTVEGSNKGRQRDPAKSKAEFHGRGKPLPTYVIVQSPKLAGVTETKRAEVAVTRIPSGTRKTGTQRLSSLPSTENPIPAIRPIIARPRIGSTTKRKREVSVRTTATIVRINPER